MLNEIALVVSSLGVGGLLGVFAKSILDKRQLKFSKVFEYKEARYKAIAILMLTAVNPSKYELAQLKMRRPDMNGVEDEFLPGDASGNEVNAAIERAIRLL